MMEKKPIAALIAVIAVVLIVATVTITLNPVGSAKKESNAAPAVSPVAEKNDKKGTLDPYGPTGQSLPPGQPRVVLGSPPAPQSGFWIENRGGTYYAVWVLDNTGKKSMDVQPYAMLNGVLVMGPKVNVEPGKVQTVRVAIAGTQLPTTAYVNVRELRGNSNNFWVAYDQNQPVTVITK